MHVIIIYSKSAITMEIINETLFHSQLCPRFDYRSWILNNCWKSFVQVAY